MMPHIKWSENPTGTSVKEYISPIRRWKKDKINEIQLKNHEMNPLKPKGCIIHDEGFFLITKSTRIIYKWGKSSPLPIWLRANWFAESNFQERACLHGCIFCKGSQEPPLLTIAEELPHLLRSQWCEPSLYNDITSSFLSSSRTSSGRNWDEKEDVPSVCFTFGGGSKQGLINGRSLVKKTGSHS